MRASRRVRMLAGIALAAMSCSQLASAAHFLWVNHVRCAEHGELLHGEGSGDPHALEAAAAAAAAAVRAEAPSITGEPHADPTSHDGDHCEVLARLAERAISPAPAAAACACGLGVAAPAFAKRAAWSPIALLMRAPKSSPPSLT